MRAKWYVIARRLLFVIPLYFGFGLCFICFYLGWGSETALRWWKNKDTV